jgi:hypothetical protein
MSSEITEQTQSAAQAVELLPPAPDARALNPVRHGMTSLQVPPEEREGYAAHVEAVRLSTGATTYLEQRLSDRAALAIWQLDRVARYEAAQASTSQRAARAQVEQGGTYGPVGQATAAWVRLGGLLPGDEIDALRADPGEVERLEVEAEAAILDRWAAGGSAAGLNVNEASELGEVLGSALLSMKVSGAQMVRAMLGQPAKRGEGASVEAEEWTYEPGEVPGLLDLFRMRAGQYGAVILGNHATARRMKAQAIREAHREALAAEHDALTLAALPSSKALEQVTRYEAHLERGLYRALHELEAARRERQGEQTPAPLRGVLGDDLK